MSVEAVRVMALGSALALVLLGTTQRALGDSADERQGDQRVRTMLYDADRVYRLQAVVGYQIELEFESGEFVTGHGAGDLEGINLASFENHAYLKPKAANVATNLTIATNRRSYRFDYVVRGSRPDRTEGELIYLLRFSYPASVSGPTEQALLEQRLAQTDPSARVNIDYWYCGSKSIRPVAASDDGVHTRLRFDARSDLPALFVRGEDGSESLLNFSMDNGDVIVHRVARRLILRRGGLTGCVVNQGFVGGTQRLESGTVSPEVVRMPIGVQP